MGTIVSPRCAVCRLGAPTSLVANSWHRHGHILLYAYVISVDCSRGGDQESMQAQIAGFGDITPGMRLTGVVGRENVEVLTVRAVGESAAEVIFRDDGGIIDSRVLSEGDLDHIEIAGSGDQQTNYHANPRDFMLAAEALRIKYAALYDPMAAVSSSNIEPLPHQIRAVYEHMLPQVPLRFLLADDPGAGKTIMAGLYLKEMMLRSDCERALIVSPGGLADQWQEELQTKFGLSFEVLTTSMVDSARGNVFADHPYLIVRMDQVSRNEQLMDQLRAVSWDVAIVDEAHRMSAHYTSWNGEVKTTKRFALGRVLSQRAQHFLLMTATPHAGKEEDFQLFLTLLDRDRFEGPYRSERHRTDTRGLMRRMVKEDLVTFEGKPLFPERRAYTVGYDLSDAEQELYDRVTEYVRTEMGRADRIGEQGQSRRRNSVGFALTVLQRRLASSPEAITRSLERRVERLGQRLNEIGRAETQSVGSASPSGWDDQFLDPSDNVYATMVDLDDFDDADGDMSEAERARFEERMEQVVDSATAALTKEELAREINVLEELVALSKTVWNAGDDRKWNELRQILSEQLLTDPDGAPRKIIVFTEHRDTIDYLQRRIAAHMGKPEAVDVIHGGTSRAARLAIREQFTHNPRVQVLLATDAAGEGLNLQRAHLMVNYDLPWNPNRIEQRFGRIHRIGQTEVCHLWNLVATGTREGDVFRTLLSKIDQMGQAYMGKLFHVLGGGTIFDNKPLRELLVEAIRYGDLPEVRERLGSVIDESVSHGLQALIDERALVRDMSTESNVEAIRELMERARARRLQPGYIEAFTRSALERLGVRLEAREAGRFEIHRVPSRLIRAARSLNPAAPLPNRYERVTFVPSGTSDPKRDVSLIALGHPLLDALITVTLEDLSQTFEQGTVLVDRRGLVNEPTLLGIVEETITDGLRHIVSRHYDYVLSGTTETVSEVPPYLDCDEPRSDEKEIALACKIPHQGDRSERIQSAAYEKGARPRMEEIHARRDHEIERTCAQVTDRLNAEAQLWYERAAMSHDEELAGKTPRISSASAHRRAREMEERLERRMGELDAATKLAAKSPRVCARALIVPEALVGGQSALFARDTAEVDQRAVAAVMKAEQMLGRGPREMPHSNPGFDISTTDATGQQVFIEVKGRIEGASTFTVTANEVAFARTQQGRHVLALVSVSPRGPAHDQLRYVHDAFAHIDPAVTTLSYNERWNKYWQRGTQPA